MLTRDDFATAVLIQLAESGETRAVYDAATFCIARQPADAEGASAAEPWPLDRWYEQFLEAEPRGRGDRVIAEFLQAWQEIHHIQPTSASEPQPNPLMEVAMTALPVGTTTARPLSPPPEPHAPPEPSWWPVLGCGLVCVLSLSCCLGGVLWGLSWAQHAIVSSVDRAKALNDRQRLQRPPVAANNAVPPLRQFALLPPADAQPLNPADIEREIEQSMREFERQVAAAMPPAVRPSEPDEAQRDPFPELDKPLEALPLLKFAPPDLVATGPEIRGDKLFQDVAPAGGWLVGVRALKGESWGGSILALQPIYQVGGEYHLGQLCGGGVRAVDQRQFLAKPGYAVGKIEAKLGLIMNAFRVEFRKVDKDRLDLADAYVSEWYGGSGGGLQEIEGGGSPLVGLAGSYHPRDELITIQALKVLLR